MYKLLFLLLWVLSSCCQAATVPPNTPEWLQQAAAKKHQAPEQMLALMTANQAQFADLAPEVQAYWLNQQAAMLSYLGRFQEQQALAQQGLNLVGNNAAALKAELLFEFGYAREMQLALTEALGWYQQGLALAQEIANQPLQVRGMVNIAAIDSLQNRDQQALETLKQAYTLAEQLQDQELLAYVNAQLGLMYSALAYEQEAQVFLEQALALYEALGWQKNRISVLYNLARNYSYLENYELAMQNFDRMLQSALAEQDVLNLYYAYSGLAITSNEMDRPQVALNYMQKAEDYLAVIQSDYYLAGHHYEKALIFQKLQQNAQAVQQLLLAEQFLQKLKDNESGNMLLALRLLKAELLAEQGQYERAYTHLMDFVQAFQQLRDKENELEVAKMRITFDAERDAVRQSLVEQEKQLNVLRAIESAHKKQIQGMWLGFVLVLGIIIFIALTIFSAKKRAQSLIPTSQQQDKA